MTLFDPMADISTAARTFAPTRATRALLGECPRWHGTEGALYWADIAAQSLHRWSSRSGFVATRHFDAPVACFAFRKKGGLILGMKNGCATIDDWDAPVKDFGDQFLADQPLHRLNDGRCDATGNIWVGSTNRDKAHRNAGLWRITPDGDVQQMAGGMATANGAAFSGDGRYFVHTDTPTHLLRRYALKANTDTLPPPEAWHQFAAEKPDCRAAVGKGYGRPDGGSFDTAGNYWTALFDGWRVAQLAADGRIARTIPLPVARPTMVAFGGADLCTAFVTSAGEGLTACQRWRQPDAGRIFAFRVETPGVAEFPFGG